MPRGALIEALLAYGYPANANNPQQADPLRDRRSSAGARDDRPPAFVLRMRCAPTGRGVQTDEATILQIREFRS